MNSLIEWLNLWGGRFVDFALPILWQSSLLIAVLFAFDFLLRRKIRAAVRYSLWFVVFLKLLLPPTLALPTGAAWWLRSRPVPVVVHHTRVVSVNYTNPVADYAPSTMPETPFVPPAPTLSREGWMLLLASAVSLFLALWVLLRWRQMSRCVRRTTEATAELAEMLVEARRLAGLRKRITLRVTAQTMSPAVCGLFRPVILLPQSLIEKLTPSQLRAVLLHELIHLRRRDVWVNCAQTLLQIVYWWHPLLWIANARMRRVREEAVDDAVMCALSAEAEVYAPTLLEVAKLAFARPLASLGLVGILESRSALRHRIERLLNFTTPRRAGVSMVSVICLAAFTALAVPMGEPPARPATTAADDLGAEKLIPYRAKVNSDVFIRNIQARASETMHTTNDDLKDILVSIMDGFGVDCTGERAIQLDPATGMVTTQNTSEALVVLDEVVKELNFRNGEHVLNPPHGLKQVLIEGQFYLIHPNQATMDLDTVTLHQRDGTTPWWELSQTNVESLRQELSDQRVTPISSPRIQTAHGIAAELSIGDATNNIQLKCEPSVHNGTVTLTVLARTTGDYAPEGKSWPDIDGHTNCAIFSRLTLTNGGTAMFSVMPAEANSRLVVLLTAKILEPGANTERMRLEQMEAQVDAAIPKLPTNVYTYTFRLDSEKLNERLATFAGEHNLNGITNHPALLMKFLTNAGINSFPPNSFFLHEGLGRADLMLNATREDLQKAADALGLDWKTEQALNDGRSVDSQKLQEDANGFGTAYTPVGLRYKTNFMAKASVVAQLVQDGKLLYQLGKMDEAELKFQAALTKDHDNQAAQYYMSLIKQTRARNLAPLPGGGGRNVPGPGAKPDDATSMVHRVQDEKGSVDNDARLKLTVPNIYARTNTIYTSPARERIYDKLNSIVFDKVAFQNLTLSEVIRTLAEQTQRRDIDQQGINFLLNKTKPPAGATNQAAPAASAQTAENVDLATVTISLDPALRNVRLLDVLEAITKSADHPISYAILDYGVEFTLKGAEQMKLHTRTFKVDPRTFYENLKNVTGKNVSGNTTGGANSVESNTEIQRTVVNFFKATGVNLAAPKSIFLNNRQGTLTVRATDDDLELIEASINMLNLAPAEVTIAVRTIEVDDEDMFKPEFGWFLEMLLKNPKSNPAGILTDPLFRTLLNKIGPESGSEVTTLSGRQAQVQLNNSEATNGVPAAYAQFYKTNSPFTLDLVPYVYADGYTIELSLISTTTEFMGGAYAPTNFISSPNGGVPVTGNLPLPRTRVRQTVTSCTLWDGQTAVLLLKPYAAHQKNVEVFVTATIIDASGNRKHSDKDLGFAQKAVPPQTVH